MNKSVQYFAHVKMRLKLSRRKIRHKFVGNHCNRVQIANFLMSHFNLLYI